MSDDIHGLFDLSAKGPKKKPEKSEKPQIPKVISLPSNQDTLAELAKMKETHAKFTNQFDETLKKAGHDQATLSKFCQNPSNFTKEQWEALQKKKEGLELMFSGLSKEALEEKKKKKAQATASKERRGKTLGSRKNWLDMR
jgi:hypothetical protein